MKEVILVLIWSLKFRVIISISVTSCYYLNSSRNKFCEYVNTILIKELSDISAIFGNLNGMFAINTTTEIFEIKLVVRINKMSILFLNFMYFHSVCKCFDEKAVINIALYYLNIALYYLHYFQRL